MNDSIRTWMTARVGDFVLGGHPDPDALAAACLDYHRARRVPDRPADEVYRAIAVEVFDTWETGGGKPPSVIAARGAPRLQVVK